MELAGCLKGELQGHMNDAELIQTPWATTTRLACDLALLRIHELFLKWANNQAPTCVWSTWRLCRNASSKEMAPDNAWDWVIPDYHRQRWSQSDDLGVLHIHHPVFIYSRSSRRFWPISSASEVLATSLPSLVGDSGQIYNRSSQGITWALSPMYKRHQVGILDTCFSVCTVISPIQRDAFKGSKQVNGKDNRVSAGVVRSDRGHFIRSCPL